MVTLSDEYVPAKDVPRIVKMRYDDIIKMCKRGEIEGARKVGRGWAVTKTDVEGLVSRFGKYVSPKKIRTERRYLSLREVSRFTGTNIPALRQQCKYGCIASAEGENGSDWMIESPRGLVQAMKCRSAWYMDNYPDGMLA
ncbi:hypothetical protein CMI45_00235 [Candidatus Pacearchaeota archaeon]|nr:hypothetical protein [Candidatus Pacearchaeota archaeon]|tara:strand:- start:781 stop:1200 length:420 start_codon:yes stop_codon:yes gene_type:complete